MVEDSAPAGFPAVGLGCPGMSPDEARSKSSENGADWAIIGSIAGTTTVGSPSS